MSTEIYLGYPPENIKKWINADYDKKLTKVVYTDGTTWEGIILDRSNIPPEDDYYYWEQIPNYDNVKTAIIGNTIKDLDMLFSEHSVIESITIPNSVTFIGEYEFNGCYSLKEIIIPDSITSISAGAFYQCESLTSITIPDSITSISERTFYDCTSLTSIAIPDSVTSIGDNAFNGCFSLHSCKISNNLSSIGEGAFRLTILNEIDLSNTKLTEIPSYLFGEVYDLTNVILPNTITSIGERAFYDCCGLESIIIPESVIDIAVNAFEDCYYLIDITFEGKTKAEVEALAGDNWFGLLGDYNFEVITIHCTDGDIILNQEEE